VNLIFLFILHSASDGFTMQLSVSFTIIIIYLLYIIVHRVVYCNKILMLIVSKYYMIVS